LENELIEAPYHSFVVEERINYWIYL
jgi:hypothetical protein